MANLPTTYQLIPPEKVRLTEVVQLLQLAAQHDHDIPAKEEDLRHQWQPKGMNNIILVGDANGAVIGVVGAVPMPSKQRLYLLFNVHPEHRQPTVVEYLMQSVEEYALSIQTPDTHGQIALVHPIHGRNLWKREVLPQFDFKVVRGMWRLEHTLDQKPAAPEFPPNVQLKTFDAKDDLAALQALVARTFADSVAVEERQAWLSSVTRDGDYDPKLWYLLKADDQLVGYVLCYPDEQVGHIALIGVDPDWRGQGLGMGLLQQAFVGFFERGIYKVEMHVDSENPRPQALRVYENVGMKEVDSLLIYEKRLDF